MDGHEENNNHHRRRKHDGKDRRHHDEMRAAATATTSTTTPHKRQRQDIRQRYDTSSESENENTDHPTKRQAKEEDEQQQPHQPRRRTIMSSSYHRAGLQGASDFAKAEAQGKKQRDTDAQRMADKYGHGETIYRRKEDGRGKVSTVRNTADEDESTKQIREMERVVLNTGRVQREQAREQMEYDRKIRESTFARHSDDVDLERIQKNAIREGDPMAAYTTTNVEAIHENPGGEEEEGHRHRQQHRKLYKGPPAKPNRYNIRPGYRWDGVDRGNGFEDKLLAYISNQRHKQEEAYRWSSADM